MSMTEPDVDTALSHLVSLITKDRTRAPSIRSSSTEDLVSLWELAQRAEAQIKQVKDLLRDELLSRVNETGDPVKNTNTKKMVLANGSKLSRSESDTRKYDVAKVEALLDRKGVSRKNVITKVVSIAEKVVNPSAIADLVDKGFLLEEEVQETYTRKVTLYVGVAREVKEKIASLVGGDSE